MSSNMKTFAVRCGIALIILAAASLAFANPFKSRIITGTSSPLVITVPDDHFLKITNFSQEGGTDRGVVAVTLTGDENSGTANVLTATRIDLSTGASSQNSPEIVNRVVIAGPAQVTIAPITGASSAIGKSPMKAAEVEVATSCLLPLLLLLPGHRVSLLCRLSLRFRLLKATHERPSALAGAVRINFWIYRR